MWDYLTPRNLLDWQHENAFKAMGERARALLAEGYAAEADRVLDEMTARRELWRRQRTEQEAA